MGYLARVRFRFTTMPTIMGTATSSPPKQAPAIIYIEVSASGVIWLSVFANTTIIMIIT